MLASTLNGIVSEYRVYGISQRLAAINYKQSLTVWISDKDGFTSHLPSPDEFDSALDASFTKKFGSERNGWQLFREGEILYHHQKTFVPDFTFRHEDSTEVLLEIVGFWTPEYLAHRRNTLQQFRHHKILIAVPEKFLQDGASIGKNVLVYKTVLTVLKLTPLMEALERIRTENVSKCILPI